MAVNYKNARLLTNFMAFICGFLGVALFVTSITFLTYPNFIEWYIRINKVEIVCKLAIALSVLVFLAAGANLAASIREELNLLKFSIALMVIAFVLNAICIIVAFVMEFRAQEDVNDQIYALMRKYGTEEFQMTTDVWDFFQKSRECCGADGPSDWKFTPFYEEGNKEQKIPRSCCRAYASTKPVEPACQKMTDSSLYYTEGCRRTVDDLIWAFIGVIVIVLGICTICEMVGAISSWMLVKELSKDDELPPLPPPPESATNQMNHAGTMRSQSTGVGSISSHNSQRLPENKLRAPVSVAGSVRSSQRSGYGREGGFTRNHANFINHPPKFIPQMPVASPQKVGDRPQMPPPSLPAPPEDSNEFDV